jgi:hypothetical protein
MAVGCQTSKELKDADKLLATKDEFSFAIMRVIRGEVGCPISWFLNTDIALEAKML